MRRTLSVVTLMALAVAVGCGALVDEDADRRRLADERTRLEARVGELERALAAAPVAAPTPTLGESLILRQFARESAGSDTEPPEIELCLELFGRGDLRGGIPPSLTLACVAIAMPDEDVDAADAIEALVNDPRFECWAGAVPGTNLPPCWR